MVCEKMKINLTFLFVNVFTLLNSILSSEDKKVLCFERLLLLRDAKVIKHKKTSFSYWYNKKERMKKKKDKLLNR